MDEYSILIGGKAGDGIDSAGLIIARILNAIGYRLYIYRDYPSIIRGGHTFSIIRASKNKIAAHKDCVDFVVALNKEALDLHKNKLNKGCLFLYDSGQLATDAFPVCGIGVPAEKILKEQNAPAVMRNSCLIGALCKSTGIKWSVLEAAFRKDMPKDVELNLKVARQGYDAATELVKIKELAQKGLPVLTGNEAVGLGLVKAGLKAYIAYPMTPTSPILHFLAGLAGEFSLKVLHPESEIAVILMALGFAYTGEKVAVGTSGGGFCLMTEGVSFSGMAELPVVVVVGQRPGPSTGLPTYTSQTELHFVLNAGQGEFARFVVAPGDAEEAYYWSAVSLNIACKYQIPSFILTDKTLGEGAYSFDIESIEKIEEEKYIFWDRKGGYKRYLDTQTGISPLTFAPDKDAIIKINSYEHDESGITSEDPQTTKKMQDKRLRKERYLAEELQKYNAVKVYGRKDSATALLCWGSNKGVCVEAAERLGIRVIHPVVLHPFPTGQFQKALVGVKKLICVENNATAQLARQVKYYGFDVDRKILRYDGRPFSLDELEEQLEGLSVERVGAA